jgi:hypothetical protein
LRQSFWSRCRSGDPTFASHGASLAVGSARLFPRGTWACFLPKFYCVPVREYPAVASLFSILSASQEARTCIPTATFYRDGCRRVVDELPREVASNAGKHKPRSKAWNRDACL